MHCAGFNLRATERETLRRQRQEVQIEFANLSPALTKIYFFVGAHIRKRPSSCRALKCDGAMIGLSLDPLKQRIQAVAAHYAIQCAVTRL